MLTGCEPQLANKSQVNNLSKDKISKKLEKHWQVDTYCNLPKFNPDILPPEQQRALLILVNTTSIEDNKLEVGPLWKKDNIILPYNRELSEKNLYYLEKECSRNPHFKQLYIQQINDYIKKRYVKKLSEDELPKISPMTKYTPHDGVRVVFGPAAVYHEASLNKFLLPGIDLLNNLVSVLCHFGQEEYAVFSIQKPCFTKCV